MSQIGIKLANRDFYPVIENIEKGAQEKEIELTTVRDGQPQVQINLFRKDGEREDFIGSLVIEDLKNVECGEATISLKLHLDEKKYLTAEAVDKDTGGKQSFGIPIDELEQTLGLASSFEDEKSDDVAPSFDSEDSESDIDLSFTDPQGDMGDVDLSFTDMGDSETGDVDLSFTDEGDSETGDVDLSFTDTDNDGNADVDLSFTDMGNEGEADIDLSFTDMGGDDTGDVDLSFTDLEDETTPINEEPSKDYEMSGDSSDPYAGTVYNVDTSFDDEKKSSFPLWLKIVLAVLCVVILSLVIVFFFRGKPEQNIKTDGLESAKVEMDEQTEEELSVEPIDELTEDSPKATEEPFATKDENEKKGEEAEEKESKVDVAEKPAKTEEKTQVKTVEGVAIKQSVRYRLRWGDTLWDISETFYKNPWKYKKIARYNGIKNPNRIVAGTYITIPAK